MTDEEMAEEYANSTAYTEYSNPSLSESLDISSDIKQAYLAGLKAGKEKAKKEIEEEFLKCYQGYPEKEVEDDSSD